MRELLQAPQARGGPARGQSPSKHPPAAAADATPELWGLVHQDLQGQPPPSNWAIQSLAKRLPTRGQCTPLPLNGRHLTTLVHIVPAIMCRQHHCRGHHYHPAVSACIEATKPKAQLACQHRSASRYMRRHLCHGLALRC